MDKLTVFTNNGVVVEFFTQKDIQVDIKWIAAPAIEVLAAAKHAARLGSVILSNPMVGLQTALPFFGSSGFDKSLSAGSKAPRIKAINPYLSVLASPPEEMVDFISVKNIDDALALYKKNARLRFIAHNDDAIRKFQTDDIETLLNTLTAMDALGAGNFKF